MKLFELRYLIKQKNHYRMTWSKNICYTALAELTIQMFFAWIMVNVQKNIQNHIEHSTIDEKGYLVYRRREGAPTVLIGDVEIDSH